MDQEEIANQRRAPIRLRMSAITKAVLLAAGRGTRMRELTSDLPKPMLRVQGKPILQHIVEGLCAAGVTDFLLIVGWRAEVVRDFFGNGEAFGVRIGYETQVVQDGTGKVVELARDFCGAEPFVLGYGDILVDPSNYRRLDRAPATTPCVRSTSRPAYSTSRACCGPTRTRCRARRTRSASCRPW